MLGTVWFVNAVNFLDGLDWITAAQVVPMTLGIAVLHALGTVPASIGFLALALLGATLGFAPFNKHPQKCSSVMPAACRSGSCSPSC